MIRISLVAAALAATTAVPAFADTGVAPTGGRAFQQTALDGSTACVRRPAGDRCASYQLAILRTVAHKAGGWDAKLSASDLGRRQLDALVATVN